MRTEQLWLARALTLGALLASGNTSFAQSAASSTAGLGHGPGPITVSPGAKEEARQRFDRGLSLYNEGDTIGALAEFELAYELTGHAMVLYNLALVRARLGHAVQAVEALEALRNRPASELAPGTLERANALYEAQLARVGWLEVKSTPVRALVQVDNVDVARTPAAPVRVTAGAHFVTIAAAGHEPRHLQVTVAGRAREVLEVTLTPLETAPALLTVVSNVPAVEVRANGEPLGRTPLTEPLVLNAGAHELELRRPGYAPLRKRVILQAGGREELNARMTPTTGSGGDSGVLTLRISEPGAVVSVDGEPRADATRGMRLPVGLHSVRVQRAGFFELARDVDVKPGHQSLNAGLLPTPVYLSDYVSRARARRTWSYLSLGAGGLLTAGGGVFLLWNQGQKSEARQRFDDYADAVEKEGGCSDRACEESLNIYAESLEMKQDRDVYGWLGVGAGTLGVTAGLLLYLLGDDPDRYDPKPESDVFGSLGISVTGQTLGINGRF